MHFSADYKQILAHVAADYPTASDSSNNLDLVVVQFVLALIDLNMRLRVLTVVSLLSSSGGVTL